MALSVDINDCFVHFSIQYASHFPLPLKRAFDSFCLVMTHCWCVVTENVYYNDHDITVSDANTSTNKSVINCVVVISNNMLNTRPINSVGVSLCQVEITFI